MARNCESPHNVFTLDKLQSDTTHGIRELFLDLQLFLLKFCQRTFPWQKERRRGGDLTFTTALKFQFSVAILVQDDNRIKHCCMEI